MEPKIKTIIICIFGSIFLKGGMEGFGSTFFKRWNKIETKEYKYIVFIL